MRRIFLFISLIILFSFNSEVRANNLRIIDGDTIELNGEKIRFSGIDTPELKQTCIKTEDGIYWLVHCGKFVREILVKKIGNNTLNCEREAEKDFFGRTLGECFVNGESLSKFLVRNGYGFAYIKYSKKYVEDEKHAKNNNLGLWAMEFKFPWDFRKKK